MGDSYKVLPRLDRIKATWERDIGKYPDTITVEMSDGAKVKYRLDVEQPHPCFERAMEIIRGYPPTYGRHEKRP